LDGDMSKGFPETKQQVKKIFMEKTRLEGELHVKSADMMAPNQ